MNLYDYVYLGFAVESIVVTIPLPVTELDVRPMILSDIIAHNHLFNFIRSPNSSALCGFATEFALHDIKQEFL